MDPLTRVRTIGALAANEVGPPQPRVIVPIVPAFHGESKRRAKAQLLTHGAVA